MMEPSRQAGPTIVPYFGYRDAAGAPRWLADAFGFVLNQEFSAPDGAVMHAEMTVGRGVVMIGTGEPPPEGDPSATSPTGHGIYVVVDDVDVHHERAEATGARIVYGPEDTDFETRRYRALDPEGYEWSFGIYSPSP
jgi:uncharacterized glyoxalase superfamily protein PhnB